MTHYLSIWLTITLLAAIASIIKSTGLISTQFSQFEGGIGGAIVLHCIVALTLGFCTAGWASQSIRQLPRIAIMLLPFILVSLDEFSQQLITTRHFSWIDLLVNYASLLFGMGGYHAFALLQQHYNTAGKK